MPSRSLLSCFHKKPVSPLLVIVLVNVAFSSPCVGIKSKKYCGEETRADRKNEVGGHGVSFLAVTRARPVNASHMTKPDTSIPIENGRPLMNCPKINAATARFANADNWSANSPNCRLVNRSIVPRSRNVDADAQPGNLRKCACASLRWQIHQYGPPMDDIKCDRCECGKCECQRCGCE
jgi:hypothetical protein